MREEDRGSRNTAGLGSQELLDISRDVLLRASCWLPSSSSAKPCEKRKAGEHRSWAPHKAPQWRGQGSRGGHRKGMKKLPGHVALRTDKAAKGQELLLLLQGQGEERRLI